MGNGINSSLSEDSDFELIESAKKFLRAFREKPLDTTAVIWREIRRYMRKYDPIIIMAGLLAIFYQEYVTWGLTPNRHDYLLLSGFGIAGVFLFFSANLRQRFESMGDRLLGQELVILLDADKQPLKKQSDNRKRRHDLSDFVESRAALWAMAGAVFICFIGVYTLLIIMKGEDFQNKVIVIFVGALFSAAMGARYGRMFSFGWRGISYEKLGVRMKPVANHVDGLAGFKPVGDFYWFQAQLLLIPLIYLAVWIIIFFNWEGVFTIPDTALETRYGPVTLDILRRIFIFMFIFILALQVFAFLAPLTRVMRELERQKRKALWLIDRRCRRNDALRQSVHESGAKLNAEDEALEKLRSLYNQTNAMRVWPIQARRMQWFWIEKIGIALITLIASTPGGFLKEIAESLFKP